MRQDGRGAGLASRRPRRSRPEKPRRPVFVRWFEEIDGRAVPEVGGKGANLGELARAGLPVPSGYVVTLDAYRSFMETSGIGAGQRAMLARLRVDEPASLNDTSRALRELVRGVAVSAGRRAGLRSSICGEAPSTHPDYAELPVRWGIDSISVNPDVIDRTRTNIARAEKRVLLAHATRDHGSEAARQSGPPQPVLPSVRQP